MTAKLATDSERVREINQRRIEILNKRLEKCAKIGENLQVIDAQCQAIEEVLLLIRDQSMTMSDPQLVSERLEGLVKDVESTEQNIRDVEAIFQMSPEIPRVTPGVDVPRPPVAAAAKVRASPPLSRPDAPTLADPKVLDGWSQLTTRRNPPVEVEPARP